MPKAARHVNEVNSRFEYRKANYPSSRPAVNQLARSDLSRFCVRNVRFPGAATQIEMTYLGAASLAGSVAECPLLGSSDSPLDVCVGSRAVVVLHGWEGR